MDEKSAASDMPERLWIRWADEPKGPAAIRKWASTPFEAAQSVYVLAGLTTPATPEAGDLVSRAAEGSRFRKKPVIIDALQWNGENLDAVLAFCAGNATYELMARGNSELVISTLEDGDGTAKHVASRYDWIIKGVKGEFYPCKPDIFATTYEPASTLPAAQVGQEPVAWPGPGRFTDLPARMRRAATISASAEVTADQAVWISDVLEDGALKIEALEREAKASATPARPEAHDNRRELPAGGWQTMEIDPKWVSNWHLEPDHPHAVICEASTIEAAECIAQALNDRGVSATPAPVDAGHPDDAAVDRFAVAMKAKLAKKRADGHAGWDGPACSAEILSGLLRDHVEKGDALDIGNFAMMLHQRGERIEAIPAPVCAGAVAMLDDGPADQNGSTVRAWWVEVALPGDGGPWCLAATAMFSVYAETRDAAEAKLREVGQLLTQVVPIDGTLASIAEPDAQAIGQEGGAS